MEETDEIYFKNVYFKKKLLRRSKRNLESKGSKP